MRALVTLMLIIAGFVASACATSPQHASTKNPAEPALRATVMEPMTAYVDGRLYPTIWLDRAVSPQDPVTAHVEGPGAPSEPITFHGDVCAGVTLETYETRDSFRPAIDDACSWAIADAVAGVYRIRVMHAGKLIGTAEIRLVELPAAGKRTVLAVDPAQRSGRAIRGRRGIEIWWPVDARFEWRSVTLYHFRDGELLDSPRFQPTQSIHGPRLATPGSPAFTVWPTVFRAPIDMTVAAFSGHVFLGAWHTSNVDVVRGTEYGYLPAVTLGEAERAAVIRQVAASTRGKAVFNAMRLVPRTCAVLSDPKAATLAADLDARRGAGKSFAGLYTHVGSFTAGNTTVHVAVGSRTGMLMTLPPWDTGKTSTYEAKNAAYDRQLAALDALARSHRTDCFTRLVGPPTWMLPEPHPQDTSGRDR